VAALVRDSICPATSLRFVIGNNTGLAFGRDTLSKVAGLASVTQFKPFVE